MVSGIGTDIVRTARIREAASRWERKFLERVYTEGEIAYCMRHANPYPAFAARFAAKEAAIKAVSGDVHIPFRDIEVVNDQNGKPSIRPGEALARILAERGILRIHLSMSHERDYATATVIVESGAY